MVSLQASKLTTWVKEVVSLLESNENHGWETELSNDSLEESICN